MAAVERGTPEDRSLKDICLRAVRRNLHALSMKAVIDLPAPLTMELLPDLTVCQLDEVQPALNLRGISTYCGWVAALRDIYGPRHLIDVLTEEEARDEVMTRLFRLVFYGFTNRNICRHITSLNTEGFLRTAAKCIRQFFLLPRSYSPLQSLTASRRPVLHLLEKNIRTIKVLDSVDLSKTAAQVVLYVLHRLLDHGAATKVELCVHCPPLLAWLLHGRGGHGVNQDQKNVSKKAGAGPGLDTTDSDDQDDHATPCKRWKSDCVSAEEEEEEESGSAAVDPQVLCRTFSPCDLPSGGRCPWGRIECLEIHQCGPDCLRVLSSALPTLLCLRSLTLHSTDILMAIDVLVLVRALKQRSSSSGGAISDLSVGVLQNAMLVERLLEACPALSSLQVEVHTVRWGVRWLSFPPPEPPTSDLSLQKLMVKISQPLPDLHFMTCLLRRCPRLTSLHVAGLRLITGSSHSQLLATLSESNLCLTSLKLEDMKLSDCLPEILSLLRHCRLEELQMNDCRLLETSSDRGQTVQQLVSALRSVSSLHTLGLAQNRLAKEVCVLAELFSGSSPSSVRRLDISSNFIQAAELLEFTERLRRHRPRHRLTLDLRKNPGDRDRRTWNAALTRLRPFALPLVEEWNSTDTMVDHVANM